MKRGELWWVDFGQPIGSSPGFERPGVVVSADRFNRSTVGTVVVVAVCSNLKYARYPGNVMLRASLTGLDMDSVANVTQVGAIDRQSLGRRIGPLPPLLLREIDNGLRLVLHL